MLATWLRVKKRLDRRADGRSQGLATAGAAAAGCPSAEFDAAPVGLARLDLDGRLQCVNTALGAMLGHPAPQLCGRLFSDFLFPGDMQRLHDIWQRLLSGVESTYRGELQLLHPHGHAPTVELSLRVQRAGAGAPVFLLLALNDLSDLHREKTLAEQAEQRFQRLLEHLPAAVSLLASDLSRALYINEAFERLWGLSRAQVYADPGRFLALVHPEDRARVERIYRGGLRDWDLTYRVLRDDGEVRHIRDVGHGLFDERGGLLYYTVNYLDISSEMTAREELRDLNMRLQEANLRLMENARLDGLTGCLNRGAFFDEAAKAMQIDTRYGRNSTLVFFDLNHFKDINDSFGHHIGDRALRAFADQIRSRLRNTDELGRYGGDEFIALLRETDSAQAAALVATLTPVVVDAGAGQSLILHYSAGIAALSDPEVHSVDDWIRIADHQMYNAKARRGGRP